MGRRRKWGSAEVETGKIVDRNGTSAWIVWDDEPMNTLRYREEDVRYWIDTDMARIQAPKSKSIFGILGQK